MDKHTRVLNALEGKPVDRVPVSFRFHFTGQNAVGETCVHAHLKYYRAADVDYIKIMSDDFFGCPLPEEIKCVSDWKHLRPQGRKGKYIHEQLERAKCINEELKGECCTFYNVFAPFSIIRFATSDELVMNHLREDKKAIMAAMDVISEENVELSRLLLTEGDG